MTDIKELFDMVETKNEPDLDSWKQQEDRQHRTMRHRKIGAMLIAATLTVAVGAFALVSTDRQDEPTVATQPVVGTIPPAALEADAQDVAVVDLHGTPLGSIPGIPQDAAELDLSPDRTQVAFSYTVPGGGTQIATIGVDGTDLRVITTGPPRSGSAAWSPDGQQIAFSRFHSGQLDLYVMNADGSNIRQVTAGTDFENFPRWSPDGATIVYTRYNGRNASTDFTQFTSSADIWSVPSTGGQPTQLTTTWGPDTYPDFSPDGTEIAYFHKEAEQGELWTMNADGSEPQRRLGTEVTMPRWSPDGTQIAFGLYDDSAKPMTSFAGASDPDGNPLVRVMVYRVGTSQIGSTGVGMIYDINAPMWWSNAQLLIHRVGT